MVTGLDEVISLIEMINTLQIKDMITIILTIIIAIAIIRIIIYREIDKINKELKRLDEKVNIYERLAKIEKKLKII